MNRKSDFQKQIIPDDLDLIREQLYSKAYNDIADITGYSYDYVHMVMNGRRRNSAIVEAARELVAQHKKMLEQLKENLDEKVKA
jgi:hypothetical protein